MAATLLLLSLLGSLRKNAARNGYAPCVSAFSQNEMATYCTSPGEKAPTPVGAGGGRGHLTKQNAVPLRDGGRSFQIFLHFLDRFFLKGTKILCELKHLVGNASVLAVAQE